MLPVLAAPRKAVRPFCFMLFAGALAFVKLFTPEGGPLPAR
jgi:hypothetical protein